MELLQSDAPEMIVEGTLVRVTGDFLGNDARLLDGGAGPAHALQRRLGQHLLELPLAGLHLGTEERDGGLPFAGLLAAHAGALHLPDLTAGYLWENALKNVEELSCCK